MKTVFALTSGDYSSYTVHCLFVREKDARRYAIKRTERLYRRLHENSYPNVLPRTNHQGDFETCEEYNCKRFRQDPTVEYDIEEFQLFTEGEVPIV